MKQTMKIDKYNLDEECSRQPDLYYEETKNIGSMVEEKSLAELELKELEANVELVIRSREDKPTEAKIKALVTKNKKVKAKRREVIKCQSRINDAMNMKHSLEQKKSMIEWLGRLYIGEYWSDVNIPTENYSREGMKQSIDKLKRNTKRRKI